MKYFSKRNEYITEYSGHEEISQFLRDRILSIVEKYVDTNAAIYSGDAPWHIDPENFEHTVQQELPGKDPFATIKEGKFHEVFTVVEIFLDLSRGIYHTRRDEAPREMLQAFSLSGSVYSINEAYRIYLKIDKDSAEKIDSMQVVFAPYPEFSQRFFQAVGNLLGRKAKSEDVVKDIFVAAEGYLKKITGTSRFGDAVKNLFKNNLINKEQKKVLEAIHEFRSDADGAGHAGNSITPTEETALWFLDTLVAQLRMISKIIVRK
ncbi:MAG: hypothetical protein AAB592_05830 [Patescibacteria group bacterium]